jgi:hypothetical protein
VEAEARRPDTTEGELTSCTKKRKTTAVAKIVDSRISVSKSKAANDGVAPRRCNEGRRFLEAGAGTKATEDQKTECAKKRKAMPVAKIVESRIPASNVKGFILGARLRAGIARVYRVVEPLPRTLDPRPNPRTTRDLH